MGETESYMVGIGAALLPIGSLIWGLVDLEFARKGVEVIYIINIGLIILCLIGFIYLAIIKEENVKCFKTMVSICAINFILIP